MDKNSISEKYATGCFEMPSFKVKNDYSHTINQSISSYNKT